ncbi:MAG TPA: adenylate/guanylate cyclase domain-containing protein, partial [Archangium sp.]
SSEPLGKILLWSDEGFSAYAMDVLRLMASTLSQRLLDYNRERIHLSQFFSSTVIDELQQVPDYQKRYLEGRDEEVGILFADINGFTRLCEQLETPARIGRFVDRWSTRVVNILWEHGGVFDKMVGDCVIGLFGPPFFRSSRRERAEALMRAACEIQRYTASLSEDPEVRAMCQRVGMEGLGVAIGANLANALCGVFGPNQDYTGFSTGMNQTARLQSLAGFRETLVMEPVCQALEGTEDPALRTLGYGPLTETPVKNVARPLRHRQLLLP